MLCEEYKRLKEYEKMLRQQFKIDLKTLKAMSKKADEMKKRKAPTAEQIAEANRKHDVQFNKNDRAFSKAVKNSVYTNADTPVEAGRPMRPHLGMTTKPTGKDRLF